MIKHCNIQERKFLTMPNFDKKFFATHEIPKYCVANIYYYSVSDFLSGMSEEFLKAAKEKGITLPDYSKEEAEIKNLTDPLSIVNYIRKNNAMANCDVLVQKITEYADSTMPLILKRYLTSGLDEFIEISGHCFLKNDLEYLVELKSSYEEIRNPYAKAVACLVFAMSDLETDADFLYQEYLKFRRMYPNEEYDNFPLLGLHLLYENNKI